MPTLVYLLLKDIRNMRKDRKRIIEFLIKKKGKFVASLRRGLGLKTDADNYDGQTHAPTFL